MKKFFAILVISMFITTAAFAEDKAGYPANYSNRPLTLAGGMGQAGLDVGLGLSKDRVAKDITAGLGFGYGITDNMELGANVLALHYAKDASGMSFGGADIYFMWSFFSFLGLYADVHVPGGGNDYIDAFGDQLVGVRIGAKTSYTIIENHFFVYGGILADLGFAKEAVAGKSPQFSLLVEAGVGANAFKELWFDLGTQMSLGLRPDAGSFSDRFKVPLTLKIGSTPIDALDVYLAFALPDINGDSFDSRAVMLGADFRF